MAPATAVEWFLHSLAGLTQTLERLGRSSTCVEVHQAAIARLRQEAAKQVAPELEAELYRQITRLNHDWGRLSVGARQFVPALTQLGQSP